MSIEERISFVKEVIDKTCKKIGKTSSDITLMAVTKKVEPIYINRAIDAGINVIGENRVQEAREKFEKVKKGVKWHMIGPLQVNKVKYAIHIFDMIQSLESIKLADEIEKRASALDKIVQVLVEVKVSFEETKHGIMPQEIISFLETISTYKHIKVKGLMTMAPFFEDKEKTRPYFRKAKELFDKIKVMKIPNIDMEILSMGMSNDFDVAIEEGSNFVRIGRAIFEDIYK